MDGPRPPNWIGRWTQQYLPDASVLEQVARGHKPAVCAMTASFVSTFAGYPLDSLKSRLQASKKQITVPKLAANVFREEGIAGFFRGLWIPLFTISFVRSASLAIYTGTKDILHGHRYFVHHNALDIACSSALGGASAGAIICFGSAPFELVKVRRQLEYSIAEAKGISIVKPPNTVEAVVDIMRRRGLSGLYNGFRLHFVRDTSGTALYFLEYDVLRHLLGRHPSGEQGATPSWFPMHNSIVPFFCGSLAGISSWVLVYPLDVVKTKTQTRALAGDRYRSPRETLNRLIRGPDPDAPRPLLAGIARLYRGLGVSALRSIITHGSLWTIFDWVSRQIDERFPPDELTIS